MFFGCLQLMLKMSTTDTPLNTVALLKEKQKQEKTPYILLTGNKGFTYVQCSSQNFIFMCCVHISLFVS